MSWRMPADPMLPSYRSWVRAMRSGSLETAWQISEQALRSREPHTRDDPSLPYHLRWVWDGEPVDGRDVLVRCYHGLGDTIQFARFLPLLRTRARSVMVELQPRLVALFTAAGLAETIVPFDEAAPLPAGDCSIEIMELGFALKAEPDCLVPPYLKVAPAPLPPETVAICCKAGDWDDGRSIPPALLAHLCESRDCITLDPNPSPLPVINPEGCPFDIMQTAALIAGAALVITVDTMVAHLAGALGRPTWLLLKHEPDWRWASETGRSVWYPSMRLYGQASPGDWKSIADRALRDLNTARPWRSRHE